MYQRDRDEFLMAMAHEGVPLDIARLLLRYTQTLHRLAVAMCNGDYPCDNGERKTQDCAECEMGYSPYSLRKGICPKCRTQARVRAICEPLNIKPLLGGDPRGAVVVLQVISGKTNWGRRGICVPVRER